MTNTEQIQRSIINQQEVYIDYLEDLSEQLLTLCIEHGILGRGSNTRTLEAKHLQGVPAHSALPDKL